MKPLSEWTDDELREIILGTDVDPHGYIAELLRRERDRCADVASDLAKEHRERAAYRRTLGTPWDHNFAQDMDELADVYEEVADRIRGMS